MEVEKSVEEEVDLTCDLINNVGLSLFGLKVFDKEHISGLQEVITKEWFYVLSLIGLFGTTLGEFLCFFDYKVIGFVGIIDVFLCFGFSFLSICKFLSLHWNRYQFQAMFTEIKGIWPGPNARQSTLDIKNRCLKRLTFTIYSVCIMFIGFVNLFISEPILSTLIQFIIKGECVIQLPFQFWFPFDPLDRRFYMLAFAVGVWAGYTSVVAYIVHDTLLQILTSHIAMLLEIVYDDLIVLIPEDWTDDMVAANELQIRLKLNEIIERHLKLIELADKTEEKFNLIVGMNLLAASIHLCLVGILGITGGGSILKVFFALVALSVHPFLLTWHGNLLVEKSVGIGAGAYNAKWYYGNTPLKRSLNIIMLRSSRPLYLTAMKFSYIELTSFTAIVGSSWSYFNLLRTMYNSE